MSSRKSTTPHSGSLLERTFRRLESFCEKEGLEPGRLWKIGLKPGWITVVGDGGECGTAFRFSGHTKAASNPSQSQGVTPSYGDHQVSPENLKELIGRSLLEVAGENIFSPLIPLRSIALAALSALSQRFLSEEALRSRGFDVKDDREVLEANINPRDVVTLIGYGGMVQNLLGKCRELHVADMRSPESLRTTIIGRQIEYAPSMLTLHGPEEDEAILGRSDVAILTGSSLVNGTIEELLRYASNARVIGLYGPSVSIIPDVLFEDGVDFVMSHHVRDPDLFVNALTTEANMELAIRKHQRYQTVLSGGRESRNV
jgi:uncharacterized protein